MLPELISKQTLTQLLDGCSKRHIDNMVRDGRLPAPTYALGKRKPRWRRTIIEEWLDSLCSGETN